MRQGAVFCAVMQTSRTQGGGDLLPRHPSLMRGVRWVDSRGLASVRAGHRGLKGYGKAVRKILIEAGCTFLRQGRGDHEVWTSPHAPKPFTVPMNIASRYTIRHSERRPPAHSSDMGRRARADP